MVLGEKRRVIFYRFDIVLIWSSTAVEIILQL